MWRFGKQRLVERVAHVPNREWAGKEVGEREGIRENYKGGYNIT